MPRNRKYYPHKSVLFLTTRTETGLPFVSSLLMNFILWGILARAKEQYNIRVCHFIFMANHLHLLLVVENPEDVRLFMAFVKGESAHAVNRLLGRTQRTVWQAGYDSPVVLSPQDVMKYICYLYLNPVTANLVERVSDYPGVSSWEMFTARKHKKLCKRLRRSSIHPLWQPALSINEQRRHIAEYETLPGTKHEFELEPNAWMDCFSELKEVSKDELNARLLKDIGEKELSLADKRREEKRRVIGATTLRRESMKKEYTPTKRSRRMICLCHDQKLRRAFIKTYRALCDKARRVYQDWRRGELRPRIPPGLFAPSMPTLASALPLFC